MTSTLNSRLAVIGFRLAGVRTPAAGAVDTDLEHTLLEALGQCTADGRLASLVFSWMHVHSEHVIVEKLAKFSRAEPEVAAWLSAIAAYACEQGLHKWAKLVRRQAAPTCLFTEQVTRSAIRLKGAIPWLERQNLLVAEVRDLSLRVSIEKAFSESGLVSLPNGFLAFPPGLRPEIEALVLKNGYVVKRVTSDGSA